MHGPIKYTLDEAVILQQHKGYAVLKTEQSFSSNNKTVTIDELPGLVWFRASESCQA